MGFVEEMEDLKRCCSGCKTTKTPLWRSGPDGPKSLCNACGIRFRKKKSPTVSSRKEPEKKKEKPATSSTTCSSSCCSAASTAGVSGRGGGGGGKEGNLMSEDLRVRLMAFGKEVVLWQRQRSPVKRQRTSQQLGEEEQAAVLLMDLSCGSVLA